MKSPRIAPVAALLALVLSAGGCGKDATGPNIALSLTDLASLAQELAGVMGSVNVASLRTVGGPLARTGPARLLRIAVPFDSVWSCPGGGTASVAGTYDTTAAGPSADATVTYTGCKTAHFTTSGSIRANGGATVTQTSETAQVSVSGSLSVSTVDGRSGVCLIGVTLNANATPMTKAVYVVDGSACGVKLSGTY